MKSKTAEFAKQKNKVEDKAKSLEESLVKFSDMLIASTSSSHDEISFWEPRTLAPYEPMVVSFAYYYKVCRTRSFLQLPIPCKLALPITSLLLTIRRLHLMFGGGTRKIRV